MGSGTLRAPAVDEAVQIAPDYIDGPHPEAGGTGTGPDTRGGRPNATTPEPLEWDGVAVLGGLGRFPRPTNGGSETAGA